MISGQLPFKGDYDAAVTYSILHEDPEPLTALRTGVPIAMDGIIAKALAKEAGTRLSKCRGVARRFEGN